MSVQSLYHVTLQLVKLLQKQVTKEERDEHIEEINQLLDLRDALMKEMKPPYTEAEMILGKEMLAFQENIDLKLKALKVQIQVDLNQLNKTKETNTKYVNPYQSLANDDGMFFDRKK
ncbi:hypothetical protein [Litchfieldia alkalitelluris]|uniref:hypothetical protein n=1 Tax=Litchfieldia alkalitelluris TaxID=304268 RepID=UPI00099783FC|nr:hypothetical protein [Litchfieldia alkalitelluris]